MLPRAVVANGERDRTVDDSPADVDPVQRRIDWMLDGVHERLRGRRQDPEDLVRRSPVPAQPAAQVEA